MTVADLTHPEKVALVVLMKALVLADAQLSRDEGIHLSALASRVGPEVFKAADQVKLQGEAGVASFLTTVARREAQQLIYDELRVAAGVDAVAPEEQRLLDLLVDGWDVVDRGERLDF